MCVRERDERERERERIRPTEIRGGASLNMLMSSVKPPAIGRPVYVYKTQTTKSKEAVEQVFQGQALTRIIQLGGPDSVYILGIVLRI